MSDNSKFQYTNRLTVYITGAMQNRLEQIASQHDQPKAEVIRAALRAYLDEQEDLIGNRKHFTKMFRGLRGPADGGINVQIMHLLYERVKNETYDLTDLFGRCHRCRDCNRERYSYGGGASSIAEDQTASRVTPLAARLERCIQTI